jgi:hypothetical protein
MPFEFADASAPARTVPPIDVDISLTFSHCAILSAFLGATGIGTISIWSVASE